MFLCGILSNSFWASSTEPSRIKDEILELRGLRVVDGVVIWFCEKDFAVAAAVQRDLASRRERRRLSILHLL